MPLLYVFSIKHSQIFHRLFPLAAPVTVPDFSLHTSVLAQITHFSLERSLNTLYVVQRPEFILS